jgi:hypothetical protein
VSSIAIFLAAQGELWHLLEISVPITLEWPRVAPRLLAGSLGALGLPAVRRWGFSPIRAGLMLSLAPSLASMFYFLPNRGHGWLGVELGALTPVVVLVLNAIWGAVLGLFVRTAEKGSGSSDGRGSGRR